MSFIPYLNACLNTLKITPEELINQDIIRTEKLLKVESKINPNLDINYLNTFLDVLKNNKNELVEKTSRLFRCHGTDSHHGTSN